MVPLSPPPLNWRTTACGALLIVSAVAQAATALLQGHAVDWPTVGGQIAGGIGLIHAADAKNL